jgi:methyltransferase (TIGR00027 family)
MDILFSMQDGKPSKTAQYMAFFRALETQQPPRKRLFEDAYAFPLLRGTLRAFAWLARISLIGGLVYVILELGWPCTRSSGVVRTRAIDDWVREAIRRGARQLVLLGAGFDSRGYRLEEAGKIAVFEVDHPSTQQTKKERLQASTGPLPAHVRYLSVDFERDNLEARLAAAGYDSTSPAVVVWEGVISYLSESAVESTFTLLSRLLAPSSCLIFTYMDRSALDGSKAFAGARRWRSWVRFSGEPFIFGFDPGTLAEALKRFGFRLQSDVSTEEIARRYCPQLGRKEPGSQAYRVSSAIREEG